MATTITPPPRSPAPTVGPQPGPDASQPSGGERRRRPSTVVRIVLGCVIVLVASVAIGALVARNQVNDIKIAIDQNKSIKIAPGALASAGWGDAQTLLLVGNDQRNHTTTAPVLPHSNEMLLVRLDPNKPWISMMSIPRELWVPIYPPNAPPVTTRFNYAYTAGGIPLLVSTIKQVLGLPVNHVIVIDFNNFERAVDEMGCVYTTIDRRYYHVNTPYDQQYQEINLVPGYQKLCGFGALQFVSYRHGDTSLVRDARDQDFLLDVKRQYGPSLIDNVSKFEQIFGQTVQTDQSLHTDTGILDLLGTLISSAGKPVRQVQFQVNLQPTYDTATPQQISASVDSFLNGSVTVPKSSTAAVAQAVHKPSAAAQLALAATPASELAAAASAGSGLTFPLEVPRVIDTSAGLAPADMNECPVDGLAVTCMRTYQIHSPDGTAYPVYVIVQYTGELGQYYDVQGTTWMGAPMLSSPDQTVSVAGRTYELFYDGAHLRTVAWLEHGAVYWIHNTLLDSVGNGAMLAIAEQTIPVNGATVSANRARAVLHIASVPGRVATSADTATGEELGGLAGLLSLLSLPLLSYLWIRRRREIRGLRDRLGALAAHEADLLTRAHTGAIPLAVLQGAAPAGTGYVSRAIRLTTPRRRRRRRPLLRAGVALLVLAGAAVLVDRELIGSSTRPRPSRAAVVVKGPPTVPVAVLNATAVDGAADQLAAQLAGHGVKIAMTGELSTQLAPGLDILYATGDRIQAERLAEMLGVHAHAVAPITAAASAAAQGAPVVVVIE